MIRYMRLSEFAKLKGVSKSHLLRLVANQQLTVYRLYENGIMHVDPVEAERQYSEYVRRQQIPYGKDELSTAAVYARYVKNGNQKLSKLMKKKFGQS